MQMVMVSPIEKMDALGRNVYFSGLGQDVLSQLAEGTQLRRYRQDEIICWFGEKCEGLYTIQRGRVKLFKLSPKGRELIIQIFSDGDTFNEVPVFDNGLNAVNVAALEDCAIWLVEPVVIRQALRQHPDMAEKVILNLSHNLRTMVGKVEELSFFQVTNRLARLLDRLEPGELNEQRLTQDQLAARLGTVREVVARSLRELERSGAIRVQRRQIQILDQRLLREWGQAPNETG